MIARGKWLIAALAILIVVALILLAMGRPPICECGTVKLWQGAVQSSENSQHISDWYSFSHVIHGFLFYGAASLLLRKYPKAVWLCAALLLECGWEIAENSPMIIERYRQETAALGYTGDSVLNSVCDALWMVGGFFFASRVRAVIPVALAIFFELFTLYMVRDNLTLNVLMLVSPVEAVKQWQADA